MKKQEARGISLKRKRWDERMGLGINEKGLSEKEGSVEEVSRMN